MSAFPRLHDDDRPRPYAGPWQPFPDALADDRRLTDGDRSLWVAIRRFQWENPGADPDLDAIAAFWGHLRTSIYPALRRLIPAGWVDAAMDPVSRRFVLLRASPVIDRDYRDRAEYEVVKGRKGARAKVRPGQNSAGESARASPRKRGESARASLRTCDSPPIAVQRFEERENVTLRGLAPGDEEGTPAESPPVAEVGTAEPIPDAVPPATAETRAPVCTPPAPDAEPDLRPLSDAERAHLEAEAKLPGHRGMTARWKLHGAALAVEEAAAPPPTTVVRPVATPPPPTTEELVRRLPSRPGDEAAVAEAAAKLGERLGDYHSGGMFRKILLRVQGGAIPVKRAVGWLRASLGDGVERPAARFTGMAVEFDPSLRAERRAPPLRPPPCMPPGETKGTGPRPEFSRPCRGPV